MTSRLDHRVRDRLTARQVLAAEAGKNKRVRRVPEAVTIHARGRKPIAEVVRIEIVFGGVVWPSSLLFWFVGLHGLRAWF